MKHTKRDLNLNVWVRPPGWKLGGSTEAEIQLFSGQGHVAYQIKGSEERSNIQAHIVFTRTLDPWGRVKCQNLFFNVVMLQKK